MSFDQSPEKTIIAFYTLLDERQYEDAFACLTEKFQKAKWPQGLSSFTKGYITMVKVDGLALAPIKQDETSAETEVTYSDTARILHHPLIDPILGDLNSPQAQDNIKNFQQFLIDEKVATPEAIATTSLDSLKEKNAIEDYLWTLKADYSRIDELFAPEETTISQRRIAVCVNTPKGWLIDDLKRG